MSQIPNLPPDTHKSPNPVKPPKEPVNLATLPSEILLKIYSYLNPAHACLFSWTCSRLHHICKLQPASVYKEIFELQYFHLDHPKPDVIPGLLHCMYCQEAILSEGYYMEYERSRGVPWALES
ncbi:hypothetical protein HYFRA_00001629 [Hymenoscyphus fraxineus]|uniref:F-box domain-containing protein n=1 Tax=Hymenoscyphus fraxineus TaxID=746836 RepID=A0A9N9PY95_9HELO|nr:hypothetical protein HYFRA_00001629 [Hymenoscyphus fraxineus]